jgi:hypothetical protein
MAAESPASQNYNHNIKNAKAITNLDLHVVDEAFGKYSDLYEDVLRVGTTASLEDIQLAYFDRRSELFTLLAKIDAKPQSESMINQRYKTERKMDSVVLAVRILGDASLRAAYDRIRSKRLQKGTPPLQSYSPSGPRLVTPTAADDGTSDIYDTSAMDDSGLVGKENPSAMRPQREKRGRTKNESPKTSPRKHSPGNNKHKRGASKNRYDPASEDNESIENDVAVDKRRGAGDLKRAAPGEDQSTAMESRQEDDTLAGTLETASTHDAETSKNSGGVFSCITGSRFFRKISNEISGACEDTLVSVDQVFNAFTLTDKDIKAVTKKIHKAKRQLDN